MPSAFVSATVRSPKATLPASMRSSVVAHLSSVDLPPPEGPMMATTSPGATSSEMERSTCVLPKDLLTSRMEKTGARPPAWFCVVIARS